MVIYDSGTFPAGKKNKRLEVLFDFEKKNT